MSIARTALSLCLCLGALSAALAHEGRPASPTQPQVIELDRYRKALWTVRVSIQGKTGDFLFDTAGGMTMVTPTFAASLDCKFNRRTTGYNMFGTRGDTPTCSNVALSANGTALVPVNIGSYDRGDHFKGDKQPDGILSLDAFDGKAFTMDQRSRTLTIETDASLAARTKDMIELPLRVSRECSARCLSVFLGVPRAQGMTWLLLDSGAGGVSLIAKDYAAEFGLKPDIAEQRLQMEIAPGISVDSPVAVTDMIMDGNLGQPFLSRHLVTIDLAHSRAWLAPNPTKP